MILRLGSGVEQHEPDATTPYHPTIECDVATAWAEARRILGKHALLQGGHDYGERTVGIVLLFRGLTSFRALGRGATWNEALEATRARMAMEQRQLEAARKTTSIRGEEAMRAFLAQRWEESVKATRERLAEVRNSRAASGVLGKR